MASSFSVGWIQANECLTREPLVAAISVEVRKGRKRNCSEAELLAHYSAAIRERRVGDDAGGMMTL